MCRAYSSDHSFANPSAHRTIYRCAVVRQKENISFACYNDLRISLCSKSFVTRNQKRKHRVVIRLLPHGISHATFIILISSIIHYSHFNCTATLSSPFKEKKEGGMFNSKKSYLSKLPCGWKMEDTLGQLNVSTNHSIATSAPLGHITVPGAAVNRHQILNIVQILQYFEKYSLSVGKYRRTMSQRQERVASALNSTSTYV